MSRNAFFASDHHFGHGNILTFEHDGKPIRPFSCVEEMNETIIERHNSVVGPNDRVYFMGDVVINKKFLPLVDLMNGNKVLLCGNHDIFGAKEYLKYFEDVRAYKVYPQHGLIVSHIPVHPCELQHRFKFNAHGHKHAELVKATFKSATCTRQVDDTVVWEDTTPPDRRYLNLCVEQLDYYPISLDTILETLNKRELA